MEFLDPGIYQYAAKHTSEETELLKKINRETQLSTLMPRMLSGHWQGQFLSLISTILKPSRILEIGTFTGYSAICLASGLAQGGKLITIDINEELEQKVRGYFDEGGLSAVINYRIGDALAIIPLLSGYFDLVFIDADKRNYSNYYDLVIDKVRKGGVIIADNVLWSGKVLNEKPDRDTRSIMEFNRKISQDNRVQNLLLPVRDGLMMIIKK